MASLVVARSICEEAKTLLNHGQNVSFAVGAAILAVLWLAVSSSTLSLAIPAWWWHAVPLMVAVGGAVLAAGASAAYQRASVAKASFWRTAQLLLVVGIIILMFAGLSGYGAVDMLDSFVEESGSKAQQQHLRVLLSAIFVQGAGTGFVIGGTVLEVRHAFRSTRERATFAVLVVVIGWIMLPVTLLWL